MITHSPPVSATSASKFLARRGVLFATMCIFILEVWMPRAKAQVPVIMDQDISSDHDDVGDLACACALANRGECTIIACICDSQNGASPLCQSAICTYFGYPNVPCGIRQDYGGMGGYPATLAATWPHLYATTANCPSDVNLYRSVLAAAANNSVVIVTTGYLTSLKNLMLSGSDGISPLTGTQLIAQKVALWSCAGGWFSGFSEFNFADDAVSSSYVVNNWPLTVPVMFNNFPVGSAIFAEGRIESTGSNPVAQAWALTTGSGDPTDYPTWGQMAVLYGVRTAERIMLNSAVTVGHAYVTGAGVSDWLTDSNPGTQGYTLEFERFVKQQEDDALVMDCAAPNNASYPRNLPPNQPSNLRATPVGGNEVDLQWTDNAWNATGFTIESRTNGVWSQVATTGAGVTTYKNTGLATNVNRIYRVVATNAYGRSDYNAVNPKNNPVVEVFPHGWTETNYTSPGTPIYNYYQNDLNWIPNNPGYSHVVVNNDSNTGQDLTINIQVASDGAYGDYYVYFFYQDQNDWYRFHGGNVNEGTTRVACFEKCIAGVITQIGASGPGVSVGQGVEGQTWQIVVSHTGNLQWWTNQASNGINVNPTMTEALNVTDSSLSFSGGKLALGTNYAQPYWGNFNYDTTGGGGGGAPPAPTGLSAMAGNAQVGLSWTASSGATSYNVYRGTTSGGESSTPVATGVTTTSYTNTGLTNGTTYYYEVAAVNNSGTSSYSNETSATPASGVPSAPTGLTATAGNAQVALNWSASTGATSYNVYSGTSSGGENSTPIATDVTATSCMNTGLNNGTTYYYVVAAVNSSGTSSDSSEASATPAAGNGGVNTFANASFETPSVGGSYEYNPPGSSWTWTNNAGIQGNGSVYGAANAPNGTQTALIQGAGGTLGTMSQVVDFTAGTYTISFYGAQRAGYGGDQPIRVSVDSTVVGTYLPPSTSFTLVTTATFTVTAGNHTVTFAATSASADNTVFLDEMSIASVGSAPATPTGLAAVSGSAVGQIALSWTASAGAQDYILQRSTSPAGGYSTIAMIAAPVVAYTDSSSSLVAGQAYYYEIAAADTSGTSAFSTDAFATPYVPASFSGWVYTYFGLNAPSSETADTADPAHDGLSNLIKYALGLNPLAPATFQPDLSQSGATWQFTFQRPANRPDLTYAVQVSSNLSSWTSTGVTLSETASGNPQTWQATYTPSLGTKFFFRLQVTGP